MEPDAPVIVLVEDDPDYRETCAALLRKHGYRLLPAATAREARDLIADHRFDLLITDLMLEQLMTGFELAMHLQRDTDLKHVPVVVISGISGRENLRFRPSLEEQLRAAGVRAYLEKPVKPQQLLSTIKTLLPGPDP